ncbi:SPOR domain-containing protein [Methylobacillus arboreus]|uniref:SPOR domain-containing protein n=1 Tax=Methylobacillus arboreus TaxID=755170 RepID=UPI001E394D79|nr:SPOR domain-containing protein [Methylobacillus arboreus]MCB5189128.1 SPOR domain-containing protein [Methylobacillus arboreus]
MKWVLGSLLLLNIALWAGFSLFQPQQAPNQHLHEPLSAEQIKLLTPEEVEALPKTGEVPGTPKPDEVYACYEWGSFSADGLQRAQAILNQHSLVATVQQKTTQEALRYWVYIPPLPSLQAAQDKVTELKALGVDVSFIIQEVPWRNAISLGVFKDERLATKLLEQLQSRGVQSAQKGVRNQEKGRVSLIINDMSAEMAIELNKQGASFPGSELKQVICQ